MLRWPRDGHLLVLGLLCLALATSGYRFSKRHPPGWLTAHGAGMGLSYVVLLTAFYVDNGPLLPLWRRLPVAAFWIGPNVIGLPLVALGVKRRTRVLDDVRALLGLAPGGPPRAI